MNIIKNPIWIFLIAVGTFFAFLPAFTKMQDLSQRNKDYQQELADLKRLNTELRREKQRLLEDPIYLEKVAREKMGLIREGEVIYRLTPADQMPPPPPESVPPPTGEPTSDVEGGNPIAIEGPAP